jgi:hypothetical protein
MVFWRDDINAQETHYERAIATNDLCGCTVVVVASPFVAIMIHILEQRDNVIYWWVNQQRPEQQAKDRIFMDKANELMDAQLAKLKGPGQTTQPTADNQFNGWLPKGQTTVTVLAPQWNADYYNTNDIDVILEQGNYVYPQQVTALKSTMQSKVVYNDETMVLDVSYRRRYGSDLIHGLDDRDIAVVAPAPNVNGQEDTNAIMASLYYDDHGNTNLARIGTMASTGGAGSK